MNILLFTFCYKNILSLEEGRFVKDQAEALVEKGNNVTVIHVIQYSKRGITERKFPLGFRTYCENGVTVMQYYTLKLPVPKNINIFIKNRIFKKLAKRVIREKGLPTISHVHFFLSGKAAVWLKEQFNIPYIVTEHYTGFARGLISKSEMKLAREVYSNSSKNLCVSEPFKEILSNQFNLEFEFLPNTIDVDRFFISSGKEKDNCFRFINVGFLGKKKNQKMLIDTFKNVIEKGFTNIRLVIIGNGKEYSNLMKQIKRYKLEEYITLYGFADRDEVCSEIQKSDCFVLSSSFETFGVVLIESLCCGIPVIATKCGGPESIIIDEKLGILTEKSIESLSSAMIRIQNMKFEKKYLRDFVIQHYSKEVIAIKLINIYENTANIGK